MTFKEFCQAAFVIIFLIGVGAWGGYTYKTSQVNEKELTNQKLVSVAKDAYQEGLANLSANYKNDLKDVLAKNKHTKEVLNYEKTKTVFINDCATEPYVRVFNEQSEQYLQKLPSK